MIQIYKEKMISHTQPSPGALPFHADSFGWAQFEKFCERWLVSGATLPNLAASNPNATARVEVKDAQSFGNPGEKQLGIDILVAMRDGSTWVVQCKHVRQFGKTEAATAIAKAKKEFGSHSPDHYLIWVTGKVTTDAALLAHQEESVTLWNAERLTSEVILHTPPARRKQLISSCFGPQWAKAFFPIGDHLLLTEQEFFSRWDEGGRLFHHKAELAGREKDLRKLVDFAQGGQGKRALILSAPGGVGKTRLLREVARMVGGGESGRMIRFINPNAGQDADLPVVQEVARTTIIHDDAHRMDLRPEVLCVAAQKGAEGVRLVLSTRPGAEAGLRKNLMDAGFAASEIEDQVLGSPTRDDLMVLAKSILGKSREETAARLAQLSDGCALVTIVGAEMLASGQIQNLDLVRSEMFCREVFDRFEDEELARIDSGLSKQRLTKILQVVALLSPWPVGDESLSKSAARFLGIQRGDVEDALDTLQVAGMLVPTQHGLRITPDLFSDHLAYKACYDESGQTKKALSRVFREFAKEHGAKLLQNLAEAEWRARQKHGRAAQAILDPVWPGYLEEFRRSSFWDRSRMIERWATIAAYQPERTTELAKLSLDLRTSEVATGYPSLDSHEQVLTHLPLILKPVAIWNDETRQRALDLMWEALQIRGPENAPNSPEVFADFAEVADFSKNFPAAPVGVLDWLEDRLDSGQLTCVIDEPSAFLTTLLSKQFTYVISRTFMRDSNTCVFREIPVSVAATRPIRDRAMALLTEKIASRGSVAAINALPALGEAIRYPTLFLPKASKLDRQWLPERMKALRAIEKIITNHRHHLVYQVARQQLLWHASYGGKEAFRTECLRVIQAMPDKLEHRLARLTLSWSHDDSLISCNEDKDSGWFEQQEAEWRTMLERAVSELLSRHSDAVQLHDYLAQWDEDCQKHGLEARLYEVLYEVARQNQAVAKRMLEHLLAETKSRLHRNAASLLHPQSGLPQETVDELVQSGLRSGVSSMVSSFIHSIRFSDWLQTPANLDAVFKTADSGDPGVLRDLVGLLQIPRHPESTDSLALRLVKRPMSNQSLKELLAELGIATRTAEWMPSEGVVDALLDRLITLEKIPRDPMGVGFLATLGRKSPRKVFDFLRKRIFYYENINHAKPVEYEPIPYSWSIEMKGIENEPGFDEIAGSILQAYLSQSADSRTFWGRLFTMAVANTSSLVGHLLLPYVVDAKSMENLTDVCELLRFEGSRIAFREPDLIERVLEKAREYGKDAVEQVEWRLLSSARPQTRSYTDGMLDARYAYVVPEAETALRRSVGRPLLEEFYRRVLKAELSEAERVSTRTVRNSDDIP